MITNRASRQFSYLDVLVSIVWASAALVAPPRLCGQTTETNGVVHTALPIKNARFAAGAGEATPVKEWRFEERRAELSFLSPEEAKTTQASVAIPEDRQGILLSATSDFARGDLVSSPLTVKPFSWVDVAVEYAIESGDPALFLCLRPALDPTLVDSEFLPDTQPGVRSGAHVRLHTGSSTEEYSLAVSILGKGTARILSVEAREAGKYPRPQKPVLVVDYLRDQPATDGKLGWSNAEKLVKVFGFPSVEFLHYTEITPEKIKATDPALIILSPKSANSLGPQSDRNKVIDAARVAVSYDAPVIGICAGHQVLAMLNPDVSLTGGREWGPTRIDVVKGDPIFEGLPRRPLFVISESHNAVVGPSFRGRMEIIASSPECKTQIIRYRRKPWYTFQGHIERGWEDSCPEAYLLWKNMFREWDLIP